MAIEVKHATEAVGVEAGNGEIGKLQWNESHELNMATSRLLGRTTAAVGPAEEISVDTSLTLSGLQLSFSTTWGDARYLQSASFAGLTDVVYDINNNIGIGSGALVNGSSYDSIALGADTLTLASLGENIAVGNSALKTSTGNANIGLGPYSLGLLTTGSDNTAIGYAAGYNLTTGSNNILIDALASAADVNNEIVLGRADHTLLNVPGVSFSVTASAMTAPGYAPGNWNTAFSWGDHGAAGYALQSITLTAGTGLTGGGTLAANRTFNVTYGTAAGTAAEGNDSRINNGQTAFGWGDHSAEGYSTLTGTETLTNKTLTGAALDGRITEEVFSVSGTTPALDPQNGTIQIWGLTDNSTPTFSANFIAGSSITLMISDGSGFAITWPTMQWAGGAAPTLAPAGYTVVELWRVGSIYYGALVGDMS